MAFVDLPDWNIPIYISGITIASIPIDIVAQTIGNIAIDIAAQTLGVVNVNIAAIAAITMNVHEVGTANVSIVASVQLNVNIAASAITLNIHETGTANVAVTSSVQLNVNIAASAITLNIHETGTANVAVTSSVQLNVNIAASAINIPIDIAAQSIGNLSVAVASSVTLNINIATSAINIPVTTAPGAHVDIEIITSITLNINISSITGGVVFNVNISSITGGVTFNVNITGSVALNVNATEVGVWNVNANITGSVAINVNVTGSVELNIKTTGGANIIIDKLTVGAYTERRSIIFNDNGVVAPDAPPANFNGSMYGKFFPRGMRGLINSLQIYCKRTAAGTINLSYAPYPGAGEHGNIVITPGAGYAWSYTLIRKMWNYDSIFIWISACSADVSWGYDNAITPYDMTTSGDAGITWDVAVQRLYIRIDMSGQTVGDLPVSGTVNNIEIPSSATSGVGVGVVVPTAAETILVSIVGAGKVERIHLYTNYEYMSFRFYIDGVMLSIYSFTGNIGFAPISLSTIGFTASTPKIQLIRYTVGVTHDIGMDIHFGFKRSFEIKALQASGVDKIAAAAAIVNLIS